MQATVIVPTRDRGLEIEPTVASLIAQRGVPDDPDGTRGFEVLLVDNGSAPDNAAVLRRLAERHPELVRCVDEPIPGLNHARNRGVHEARGELLVFVDDDTIVAPDMLQAYLRAFAGHPRAWAGGGRIVSRWEQPRPDWLDDDFECYLSAFDRGEQVVELHYDDYPRGANMAFRREAFAACGTFHPQLDRRGRLLLSYGEIEMIYRVEQSGHAVLYVPDARVEHRIRTDRLHRGWFAQRYYWQGRSQAIFEALHHGRLYLLKKLPYRLLRSLISRTRGRRRQHQGLVVGSLGQLLRPASA